MLYPFCNKKDGTKTTKDRLPVGFTCRSVFLNNLRFLPELPGNIVLCTVDVVGLYSNIPQKECLSAVRKRLDNRMGKYVSSNTLCDLTEVVLKNNIFKFSKKY